MHTTVVDFDADLNLQRAAEPTGRTYSTITDLSEAALKTPLPGLAALILLRWPRPATDEAGSDANSLLSCCWRHLAEDGSTIVVVTTTQPSIDGASYSDYEQVLLPAARTAGLHHLHDIAPIDAVDGRDAFTYATDQRTARVTDSGTPRQDRVTTLVVFGHPGGPLVGRDIPRQRRQEPGPEATENAARSCQPRQRTRTRRQRPAAG